MECLLQAFTSILQGFLPIYPTRLGGAHQHSGAVVHTGDFTTQFIPTMFCGVTVWRSYRLLHHGDVALLKEIKDFPSWVRYSFIVLVAVVIYPRNTAWQIALRCFAKCPCRAHWWGICRGAHEAIWHQCEKLPRLVSNHHQLAPYKPSTFAGKAHHVNDVPLACHLPGKVGIWTRHWRRHDAKGSLSGSATSVPHTKLRWR